MSTTIEWTDETWNPVTGCTKVSQGCKHCYAERIFNWKKPRRIFVNSMSDLFHEAVPDEFIFKVFETICACQGRHTFQILTKRPWRMLTWFLKAREVCPGWFHPRTGILDLWQTHVGISCEDQPTADERIPLLLQTPAAVRFVSIEPLLRPIQLTGISSWPACFNALLPGRYPRLDWVIAGGESGPHARPSHPDWFRSLRDQCVAAGVPFFFKQWGAWVLKSQKSADVTITKSTQFGVVGRDGSLILGATGWNGRDIDPDTGEAYMLRVGKKAAGAMLDGRMWREFPA